MLDLFGRGYVIDHCISSFKNRNEEKTYRMYVTDALFALTNMANKHWGGDGNALTKRYAEIITIKKEKDESAEDIINRIKSKIGG